MTAWRHLVVLLGAVGCAGTAGGPLPVAMNRNAENADRAVFSALPGSEHVALWCSAPQGSACVGAASTIGSEALATEAIPSAFFLAARDVPDDCFDADLMPWMERVTRAIGASTRGWTDQEGQLLNPTQISDLFVGSGCTNAAAADVAVVKIQIVDRPDGTYVLIRVWERGDSH